MVALIRSFFLPCCFATLATLPLVALNLSEKRASFTQGHASTKHADEEVLRQINQAIAEKKNELHKLYTEAQQDYENAHFHPQQVEQVEEQFKPRLSEVIKLKAEIKELEEKWILLSQQNIEQEQEGLWHQPDTTIGQLVIDYGSGDYIYLIPPEIASLKVHVSSQLSVPRALWSEMLELVLAQYGLGVKQLNPFMRQLFFLRLNQSSLVAITDSRQELQLTDPDARICFVLQPPATEMRRIYQFIEKFAPQEQMNVQILGNNICIVGLAREVSELLKIYDFIAQPKHKQEYRLVALQKVQSEEIAKILQSLFEGDGFKFFGESNVEGGQGKHMPFVPSSDGSAGFRVLTLKYPAQSLFLVGKTDQIDKACQIIQEIETRIGEVQDKTIHWYACRHSEADELADVLSQVYTKMMATPEAFAIKGKKGSSQRNTRVDVRETYQVPVEQDYESHLIVSPPKIAPGEHGKKRSYEKHENFIVDTKTNSLVMVVESYILPKLRELLKKLDVPKKMVQLDILLFEKRVSDNNSFGLNLLRAGTAASDRHRRSWFWNNGDEKREQRGHHHKHHEESHGDHKGIFSFLISRHAHGIIPAYDLAYSFLIAQEDIQINANPSVTTVNQTPAKIAVVEQISINTGVIEIDTTKATRLKDSFSREEYGITIQITPTIHAKIDDEESNEGSSPKFIHLETDVVFDTTRPSKDNRPDVTRRNIKNEVRVADGETVILGGLRRKIATDKAEMIPFLGELPGLGKLFSITDMTDSNTEMFIFVTPRIVPDQTDEFRQMRQKTLRGRPGDIPEFLEELQKAQNAERRHLFENSMKMLLGR